MRIFRKREGFETKIQNGCISKIVSYYLDDEYSENTIHYVDGGKHTIKLPVSVYNSQFGLMVSSDSKFIYVSSWEKGLMAYDIKSGELAWRYKSTRICKITVYDGFVIVSKDCESIIKINEKNGEAISEIKSGTITDYTKLNSKYILVERIRGKLSLVNVNSMEVISSYSDKIVYPNGSVGQIIKSAYLSGKELHIVGSTGHFTFEDYGRFDRVIDYNTGDGDEN